MINSADVKMNTSLTPELIRAFQDYFFARFNQKFECVTLGLEFQMLSKDYHFTILPTFIQCGLIEQMEQTLRERLDLALDDMTILPSHDYVFQGDHSHREGAKYSVK